MLLYCTCSLIVLARRCSRRTPDEEQVGTPLHYICRLKSIDEFIADTTQLKTRVQSMLRRKKQHAHKYSIVVFKTTEHFARYLRGIIHEMKHEGENISCPIL